MKLPPGQPDRFVWGKPTRVVIDGDYLSADFGSETYPLQDAIDRARALRALVRVDTEEDARQFTENWGFLLRGWGNEQTARFPLQLFSFVRARLDALSRLASACRSRRDLPNAIRAVDRAVEQLADYFHYAPDWETEHARIWVDDLPDGVEEPWPRAPGVRLRDASARMGAVPTDEASSCSAGRGVAPRRATNGVHLGGCDRLVDSVDVACVALSSVRELPEAVPGLAQGSSILRPGLWEP